MMGGFIDVEIYADEQFFGNYIVFGCLFIPTNKKQELVRNLLDERCLNNNSNKWVWKYEECSKKETCQKNWHESNNTEIHYKRLQRASYSLKEISSRWLKYVRSLNKSGNPIRFNLLYINLQNLNIRSFGTEKTHENIYNRFFRTCVSYGCKSFFEGKKVRIRKVYHDIANVEKHRYFPYLNLQRLEIQNRDLISVSDPEISFINSDHRKDMNNKDDSQLIQLIDLILGASSQNILNTSNNSNKKEIAMILRPLVERLITKPRNVNSSYNYVGYQNIIFWPSKIIDHSTSIYCGFDGEMIEIENDLFYRPSKLEMPYYNPSTLTLDKWGVFNG